MTTMAKRIQRKRTAGWRMPADTIYVGRPTRWGNPFAAPSNDYSGRNYAAAKFSHWVEEVAQRDLVAAIKTELRGKDLACWCPEDHPCHADILLRIANQDD